MKLKNVSVFLIFFLCICTTFFSCKKSNTTDTQAQFIEALESQNLTPEQRYTIINQMATNLLQQKNYNELILFLTNWIENNPDEIYNSYWLLMTAYAYLATGAEPVAEYYFNRILKSSQDLLVKGKSIHFTCLQNLIQISKTPAHKIRYFNMLISDFQQEVNITELYLRLAMEYGKDNQWDAALETYTLFLEQPDATTIQIPGEPDAYKNARHFVDFAKSSKDWTFTSLTSLEEAVKKAIKNYDWKALDKYKAKVNFFSMSWNKDEMDANSQTEFSMRSYMRGNRIRYSETLDESSTPTEAYLRTTGWNSYLSVWYLYFRKVNFPVDPDIHGTWEWAGIYMGNKL